MAFVKCPKCGGKIDNLTAYSLEENEQTVSLENNNLNWDCSEVVDGSCKKIQFVCPDCGKVLFTNKGESDDSDVIEFLKTGNYHKKDSEKVEFT
jgi:predicted RNA-binding Zn-ribbon protein involved in translation (DUF1610 family)